MTEKKSILEQALLQVQTLEDAVKQNAKGILASTMKQELNDLIKEQEKEDFDVPEDDEEDVTGEKPGDEVDDVEPDNDADDVEGDDVEGGEFEDEPVDDTEGSFEDGVPSDEEEPVDDESIGDDETLDMTGASDDEVLTVFKAMDNNDGIIVKAQKDGKNIKLDVDNNEYIIKLDEQYLGNDFEDDMSDLEADADTLSSAGMGTDEDYGDYGNDGEFEEETIYEIELDDEGTEGEFTEDKDDPYEKNVTGKPNREKDTPNKGGGNKNEPFGKSVSGNPNRGKDTPNKGGGNKNEPFEKSVSGKRGEFKEEKNDPFSKKAPTKTLNSSDKSGATADKTVKKGEYSESARTAAFGYRPGIGAKKAWTAGNKRDQVGNGGDNINEQVKVLKKQNDEYKKALVLFKDKLNEVAVFNANLAYSTRLFTEHTTTKQEKMNILKRFDSISTISESRNLYGQIKTELETKKPVTESVVEKISSTPTTSAGQEVLSESKAYENPQFKRMKELMTKIK